MLLKWKFKTWNFVFNYLANNKLIFVNSTKERTHGKITQVPSKRQTAEKHDKLTYHDNYYFPHQDGKAKWQINILLFCKIKHGTAIRKLAGTLLRILLIIFNDAGVFSYLNNCVEAYLHEIKWLPNAGSGAAIGS